jgi:hypothetical protein
VAKQSNIITLEGKLGGISFYKRGGKYFARKSSGPSKSKIMSSPSYERTRQNLKEFSGVAGAAAAFNKCFNPVKTIKDGNFHRQISSVMRSILQSSQELLGQRSVRISQHRSMLSSIELNSSADLSAIFCANVAATHPDERNSASVVTDAFKPATAVVAPTTATHFQLVQFISIVSDTVFEPAIDSYQLANEALNGKSQVTYSEYYQLNSQDEISIALDSNLPGAPSLANDVTVIQCVGIIFFDYIGSTYHPVHASKAMKIVDVF